MPDLITPGLDALRHVGRTYATTRFVRDGATLYVTDGAAFVALPDRWPDVAHDPWSNAAMVRRMGPRIVAAIRSATAGAYPLPVAGNLDAVLALGRSCACGGLRVNCEECGGDGEDKDRCDCLECDGIGTVECDEPCSPRGEIWPDRHRMVGIDVDPQLVASVFRAFVALGVEWVRMSRASVKVYDGSSTDALAIASEDGQIAACVVSMKADR